MATEITSVFIETMIGRPSPYETTDPISSITREIAWYLRDLAGLANALDGWPEHPEAFDLSAGPVVSVTYATHREDAVPPDIITGLDLWRRARLAVTVQVDVWARYRAELEAACRVVSDAWDNRLPFRSGLHLTSRGYHGRPIEVYLERGNHGIGAREVAEGEWRRTWMAEAVSDIIGDASGTPNQDQVTLRPTVDDVAFDDIDIP